MLADEKQRSREVPEKELNVTQEKVEVLTVKVIACGHSGDDQLEFACDDIWLRGIGCMLRFARENVTFLAAGGDSAPGTAATMVSARASSDGGSCG